MAGKVNAIPDGYEGITPYLVIKGASAAIDFYKKAFGAVETVRMPEADGRIGHAELKIGEAKVMRADEFPEMNIVSPATLVNSPVGLLLYVEDSDAIFNRAVSLGATAKKPVTDQIYGDRSGTFEDPFGHKWTIATRREEVTPQEMKRRMAAEKKK